MIDQLDKEIAKRQHNIAQLEQHIREYQEALLIARQQIAAETGALQSLVWVKQEQEKIDAKNVGSTVLST